MSPIPQLKWEGNEASKPICASLQERDMGEGGGAVGGVVGGAVGVGVQCRFTQAGTSELIQHCLVPSVGHVQIQVQMMMDGKGCNRIVC